MLHVVAESRHHAMATNLHLSYTQYEVKERDAEHTSFGIEMACVGVVPMRLTMALNPA